MNTICQISTPTGIGGISIIKVSGDEAINIVNSIFKGQDLLNVDSHTLNHGYVVDNNIKIDEVLVSVMKGPKTYTGEDVVEINCHGGLLITNKILKILLNKGIELAMPGEFTKRAFLNGKKNIEEVQTIMDLIDAKNEEALNIAINSLNNSSLKLIETLRDKLLNIVSNIDINIDYPEYEDLNVVNNEQIKSEIHEFKELANKIITDSKNGQIIKNGINTAIIGKPNVGKSSLLNYLAGSDKAIVTNLAGTTRDIIENEIILNKLTLNLLDTAGIRETSDEIEKIGVNKSIEQIQNSELILFVLDKSSKINEDELNILKLIKQSNKPYVVIINKDDQNSNINLNELDIDENNIVYMSTLKGYGQDELGHTIEKIFDLNQFDAKKINYIANVEHIYKLEKIYDIILKVENNLNDEVFIDLISIDLKEALFILGDILGLEVKEDYLNEMFSRFCVGK